VTAKEAWSRALGARWAFQSESSELFDAVYRRATEQIELAASRGFFAVNLPISKLSDVVRFAWEKTALLEVLTNRLVAEGFVVKPISSTELGISWSLGK
jgi:hypothetical protein